MDVGLHGCPPPRTPPVQPVIYQGTLFTRGLCMSTLLSFKVAIGEAGLLLSNLFCCTMFPVSVLLLILYPHLSFFLIAVGVFPHERTDHLVVKKPHYAHSTPPYAFVLSTNYIPLLQFFCSSSGRCLASKTPRTSQSDKQGAVYNTFFFLVPLSPLHGVSNVACLSSSHQDPSPFPSLPLQTHPTPPPLGSPPCNAR